MACSMQLPFWPTSYDCVKWSKNNHIAVLGGEDIVILSPRLKEPLPDSQWWERSHIKVSTFTNSELPRPEVLPDRSASLGEELSIHQTISAEWSSPGLARHRGCVLAILTSNHVLSIWAKEGEGGAAKWRRVLVVNQAIRAYYEQIDTGPPGAERVERKQIQQRIRAFAWSEPLFNEPQRSYKHLFPGKQFLLVSTEGGNILVLRVDSPYQGTANRQGSWALTVTGGINTHEAGSTALDLRPTQADLTSTELVWAIQQRDTLVADSLVLSGWHSPNSASAIGAHRALLTLTMGGRLFTTSLLGSVGNESGAGFGNDPELKWHMHDRSNLHGPLRHGASARDHVVAFGEDAVVCGSVRLDANKSFDVDFDLHHLDGRWDDVTGAAIYPATSGRGPILHIVSHLSSATAATAALPIPFLGRSHEQPMWQLAINNAKSAYGAEMDIGSNVRERTWGIAASSSAPYVVTCVSMHTTDIIAYLGQAQQTSVLSITHESQRANQTHPAGDAFTLVDAIDSEIILFWLRVYFGQIPTNEQSMSDLRNRLVHEVVQTMPEVLELDQASSWDNANGAALTERLRIRLLEHADVRKCHATRLVDIVIENADPEVHETRTIVTHIGMTIRSLSSVVPPTDDMSLRMKKAYNIAGSMLGTDHQTGDVEPSTNAGNEFCKICHEPIAFESFKWARCERGHQFSRCRLSLLAIQEPGMNKSCGICGLQYFNEMVFVQVAVDGDRVDIPKGEAELSEPANGKRVSNFRGGPAIAQSMSTLAALLFAACDVCVYCGGKFID